MTARSVSQLGRVGVDLISRVQPWSRCNISQQSATIASGSSAAYSSTSASTSASSTTTTSRNRFLPSKSTETGRWRPAIPLRHQSRTIEKARLTDTLESLPEGPKKSKLLARIQQAQSPLSSTLAIAELPLNLDPSSQSLEMTKNQRVEQQTEIIRYLVAQKGPYMGRGRAKAKGLKRFFKGTKVERNRPRKAREIQENLAGMEERVQEWRKNKRDAALKARPAQPF